MSQVVFLHHRGARCAIPAAQVSHIGDDLKDALRLDLFESDEDTTEPYANGRCLLVETRRGRRVVTCEQARLGNLADATLFELPEILRMAFARPYVVGIADTPDGLVWLIDLLELPGEAHEQ